MPFRLTAPGRTLPKKSSEAFDDNKINVVRGDTRAIAANRVGVSSWKVQGAPSVKSGSVRKTLWPAVGIAR